MTMTDNHDYQFLSNVSELMQKFDILTVVMVLKFDNPLNTQSW